MSLFDSWKKSPEQSQSQIPQQQPQQRTDSSSMARLVLNSIQDGILIVDKQGLVKMINPAAVAMSGCSNENFALGFDVALCIKLEKSDGAQIPDAQNPFLHAIRTNQVFKTRDFVLISKENGQKTAIALNVIPTDGPDADRIITFRDIEKEKEEEDAQSEFISIASHEMRTPVASIEGYLGLALNPQTATIDERARGYLEAAHNSSEHLGRLFQDLLDVTKLDDKKIQPHFAPVELTSAVKQIVDEYIPKFKEKSLNYTFGAKDFTQGMRSMQQPVYASVDMDFLREIVSNLVENAIKYTPNGKSVVVNVQGDEKEAVVTITDSGIGIMAEDLQHIFQKFYRVDNSQTREIGGTGLGLYLVKQRAEAMNGRAWAESIYGQGSTFAIAVPRLTHEEFEKRKIALNNELLAQKAEQERQLQEVKALAQQRQQQTTQNNQNIVS